MRRGIKMYRPTNHDKRHNVEFLLTHAIILKLLVEVAIVQHKNFMRDIAGSILQDLHGHKLRICVKNIK